MHKPPQEGRGKKQRLKTRTGTSDPAHSLHVSLFTCTEVFVAVAVFCELLIFHKTLLTENIGQTWFPPETCIASNRRWRMSVLDHIN